MAVSSLAYLSTSKLEGHVLVCVFRKVMNICTETLKYSLVFVHSVRPSRQYVGTHFHDHVPAVRPIAACQTEEYLSHLQVSRKRYQKLVCPSAG